MKRTFLFVLQTPKVDGAILESAKVSLQGIACLTGHHLILYSHKGDQSESILLKNVDSVEKRFLTFFIFLVTEVLETLLTLYYLTFCPEL